MTYILQTPEGKFECLCGQVMDTYFCRCPGCKEENMVDGKGGLIKN